LRIHNQLNKMIFLFNCREENSEPQMGLPVFFLYEVCWWYHRNPELCMRGKMTNIPHRGMHGSQLKSREFCPT